MTRAAGQPAVSDEMLNAYVDGALDSEQASWVAQKAADDQEIANRIAMLHHLKAGIASIAEDAIIIHLPASLPVAPYPRRRRYGIAGLAMLGVIASAAFFEPAAVWFGTTTDPAVGTTVDDRFSGFAALHDDWITPAQISTGDPHVQDWLKDVMRETGLSLVRASTVRTGAGAGVSHFAFLGPKGCRLSLFETASLDEGVTDLDILIKGGLLTAEWTAVEHRYALVARDLDSTRFAAIAAAVYDATRSRGAVDPQLLANVRQARQPCLS